MVTKTGSTGTWIDIPLKTEHVANKCKVFLILISANQIAKLLENEIMYRSLNDRTLL